MKVKLEHRWERDTIQVWLYEDTPPQRGLRVYRLTGPDTWEVEAVEPNVAQPAPSFELPADWLTALVEAAADFAPPSSAQAEHLKDAVQVRDRLLTLVEHSQNATTLRDIRP